MIDVIIPQIGESVTQVIVGRWLCNPGDRVQPGDALLELDSDKASMELPAPVGGVLVEQLAAAGDEIPVGAVVARIEVSGSQTISTDPTPVLATPKGDDSPQSEAPTVSVSTGEVRAGPAARHLARSKGMDLSTISGTGPRGRVTTDDIFAQRNSGATSMPKEGRRVPMTSLRRTIARRLVKSQQEAAILTTFNEVDMSRVMAFRKRYQEFFTAKYSVKLGFMSFFVKATVDALQAYPEMNAEIDGTDILYKGPVNMGVAVSTEQGLVVPVLRDVGSLSFAEIELGINHLAERARTGDLSVDDLSGGSFTISNGGVFGSMMSTPILNPPQVGILGMHNIIERPVGVNGEICLRPMMYLALSYDHRLIDGRGAVRFLVHIKECIEQPERLFI